jgi:hypothetical protein
VKAQTKLLQYNTVLLGVLKLSNLKILVYSVDPGGGLWIVEPIYPFMDLDSFESLLSQSSYCDSRPPFDFTSNNHSDSFLDVAH